MGIVVFKEFAPDASKFDSGKLSRALNVIPITSGYIPANSFIDSLVGSVPDRVHGGLSLVDPSGVSRTYVGTSTRIYELSSQTVTDIGRQANYALQDADRWSFALHRNRLIATSGTDPVQSILLGGDAFTDLFTSTRKPRAKCLCISALDWLTLGNVIEEVDGETPSRVWWCARGNPANADPNTNNRSGYRDLDYNYGEIVSLHSKEFTTVYQDRAVTRMTYVGGAETFRFDLIEVNVGPISPFAIAHFGPASFYLSEAGFMYFDGTRSYPIGEGKVNNYIAGRLSTEFKHRMSTVIYPKLNLVVWGLPVDGSANINILVFYNWVTQQFSINEVELEIVLQAYTVTAGIDDLIYRDLLLDTPPYSEWFLDDPQFKGGSPVLAGFNSSHTYVSSSGIPKPATFETNYISLTKRASIEQVVPLVADMNNPVLYINRIERRDIIKSDRLGPYKLNLFGEFRPPGVQGSYLTFELILDKFSLATGLDINLQVVGLR